MDDSIDLMPPDPDRDALMAAIRRRVAEKKASGAYTVDALTTPASRPGRPFQPDTLAELGRMIEVTPNLALARSSRRGVGVLVGKVKTALTRATSQPLLDTADKTSAFNALLLSYVIELGAEVERLRSAIADHGINIDDRER